MDDKKQLDKAAALDRIVNFESYISNMTEDELIAIVIRLDNFEEAASALTELSIRDKNLAAPYSAKILEENLGDSFLQALAFQLLYEGDSEKAVEIVSQTITRIPPALLAAIMDDLSTDSLQPFGRSLTSEFLKEIVRRYTALSEADQKRILEPYEWFLESYKDKLV